MIDFEPQIIGMVSMHNHHSATLYGQLLSICSVATSYNITPRIKMICEQIGVKVPTISIADESEWWEE